MNKETEGKMMAGVLQDFLPALKRVAALGSMNNKPNGKYERGSWLKVENAQVLYLDAFWRHQLEGMHNVDPETGEIHLVAMTWNLLALLVFHLSAEEKNPGVPRFFLSEEVLKNLRDTRGHGECRTYATNKATRPTEDPTTQAAQNKALWEAAQNKALWEAATIRGISTCPTEDPTTQATQDKALWEAATVRGIGISSAEKDLRLASLIDHITDFLEEEHNLLQTSHE